MDYYSQSFTTENMYAHTDTHTYDDSLRSMNSFYMHVLENEINKKNRNRKSERNRQD